MNTTANIWLDTRHFNITGGWLVDNQYVHLMGMPYLIASGAGTPVDDAYANCFAPQPGTYRLWARTRNWVPEHAPGKFEILINNKPTGKVLGAAPSGEWLWEQVADVQLKPGPNRLTLHDLTGYFGRCSAVLLTTDLEYVPPTDVEGILRERSRITGLPLEPEDLGEFDLVVVGSGPGGFSAAVMAARLGLRVAMLSDRPVLGGNASNELGVAYNGASSRQPNAREGGIAEEICRLQTMLGFRAYSVALRRIAQAEQNLSVFDFKRVIAAEMIDATHIGAVKAIDTQTGMYSRYTGRFFVDGTGDGWLGYYAGAKYRFGREARGETGESLAPEVADNITMSGCLLNPGLGFRAEDAGHPVPFVAPPWAPKFKAESFCRIITNVASGTWWMEHPGDVDDVWDGERARDELIKISYGYFDFIKNEWPEKERAANHYIVQIPLMNGRREGMRLVGDYFLTQNDVEASTDFDDKIAYAGWPIDVHHPRGIFSGKEGTFLSNMHVPMSRIPYRCCYSVNIENLFASGRCISVSHVALGTVRVEATIAMVAQAVGTAAWLCLKHNTTPRGIYQHHLHELQQTLMKYDQYIPGLRSVDVADLARQAQTSASSVKTTEIFDLTQGEDEGWLPLDRGHANSFPREHNPDVKSVFVQLKNERDEPAELPIHIRESIDPGDFTGTDDIGFVTLTIPAKFEGWIEVPINRHVEVRYVWTWTPPVPGLFWMARKNIPLDYFRAEGDAQGLKWRSFYGRALAIRFELPSLIPADCGSQNVNNGYGRIKDEHDYMWVSDPDQAMPQWVELRFAKPVKFNTVYLTFDTDMNNPPMTYANKPRVPQCVRDYELIADGRHTLAVGRENFQRRRVHRFPALEATTLRLNIIATNGDPSARVHEIRVYHE